MPVLKFDVPSTFWNELTSTSLHFRRIKPGDFVPVPTDLAVPFLAGSGALALPRGWHELLEAQLDFVTVNGGLGIRPRMHLRRVLVSESGRADRAAIEAKLALPNEDGGTSDGWWLNDDEDAQVFAAMDALIDSQPADSDWVVELLRGPWHKH